MWPGGPSQRPCGSTASEPLVRWPSKRTPIRVVLKGSANTWIREKICKEKKIKNEKKEKERRCVKVGDEQGDFGC